jgi:hypothetical protein
MSITAACPEMQKVAAVRRAAKIFMAGHPYNLDTII